MYNLKVIWFVFIISTGRTVTAADECTVNIDQLANLLETTLKLCLDYNRLLDTNLLFGLSIVSGQLKIIESYDLQYRQQNRFRRIGELCEAIFNTAAYRSYLNAVDYDEMLTKKKLLSPSLWTFDSSAKKFNDSYLSSISTSYDVDPLDSLETVFEFRLSYDECLKKLIQNCHIPITCSTLVVGNAGNGYVTTHQILYLQIARQLIKQNTCRLFWEVDFNHLIEEKCSRVFVEMQHIKKYVYENDTIMDLFIEQDVVCGLENYVEFFRPEYLRVISTGDDTNNFQQARYTRDHTVAGSIIHLISVRMVAIILHIKHAMQRCQFHTGYSPQMDDEIRSNT